MSDMLHQDAEKFAEFLLANYPPAREWSDPVGYCAWNIAKGFIAAAVDDDGKIVAMCAMRPVDRPGLGVLPYYVNEFGSCLHIDLLIDETENEKAVAGFRELFGLRFGRRETVTMFRHHEEAMRVYLYSKFWQNLRRIAIAKRKKKERKNGITTTKQTAKTA